MERGERRRLTFYSFVVAPIAAGVMYFLVMEHWVHMLEFLPYLVLLLCPLMHVFMHGGHGHGHRHGDGGDAKDVPAPDKSAPRGHGDGSGPQR